MTTKPITGQEKNNTQSLLDLPQYLKDLINIKNKSRNKYCETGCRTKMMEFAGLTKAVNIEMAAHRKKVLEPFDKLLKSTNTEVEELSSSITHLVKEQRRIHMVYRTTSHNVYKVKSKGLKRAVTEMLKLRRDMKKVANQKEKPFTFENFEVVKEFEEFF